MNKYDKLYYERYARLTLYSIFPEWETHFLILEQPDLQNEKDSIGIEVTSSIPTKKREIDAYGAKLLGKKVARKDEERFWGKLFLNSERIAFAFSPANGLGDTDISPQIISAVSKKRDKWKGYKVFHTRGLYIFTGSSFINETILRKIEKTEAFSFFQIVFVNAIDAVYYHEEGWKKVEFTDKELSEFKQNAMEQ